MRVFFSADLPGNAKREIVNRIIPSIEHLLPGVKWIPLENYHMTLRFIGTISETSLHDYQDALMNLAGETAFDVRASQLIWLPDVHHRRVLALGVESAGRLSTLNRRLQGSGSFIAHITLARGVARANPENLPVHIGQDIEFQVTQLSLRQSDSGPEGVHYPSLSVLSLITEDTC